MKVTDEMVRKACWARFDHVDPDGMTAMRLALEAALADVPEPEPGICVTLDERELWAMETDRADAAEAKLAKVREMAIGGSFAEWKEDILIILDEE
jgi:hypothetical protein